jgi:hypothetical protein
MVSGGVTSFDLMEVTVDVVSAHSPKVGKK